LTQSKIIGNIVCNYLSTVSQEMSAHKDIEAVTISLMQIHKISEVLAEAFAKVKYITEDYLKSAPK
jgi:hypothetical protein